MFVARRPPRNHQRSAITNRGYWLADGVALITVAGLLPIGLLMLPYEEEYDGLPGGFAVDKNRAHCEVTAILCRHFRSTFVRLS